MLRGRVRETRVTRGRTREVAKEKSGAETSIEWGREGGAG